MKDVTVALPSAEKTFPSYRALQRATAGSSPERRPMGDRKLGDRKAAKEERRARRELRSVARELTAIHYRLLGIPASLPPRDDEVATGGDMDPAYDAATEMRLAIQCVLRDNLQPAIASLRAAARFKAERREEE
jgi:hypothetical protein